MGAPVFDLDEEIRLMVAMVETLSHLEYLVGNEELVRDESRIATFRGAEGMPAG